MDPHLWLNAVIWLNMVNHPAALREKLRHPCDFAVGSPGALY